MKMNFEICPCCGKPKRPKVQPGRWPPNVTISHLPSCERLGVKRVGSGETRTGTNRKPRLNRAQYGDMEQSHVGIDNYGEEAVTAHACVLACDGCGHQWTAEQRGACPECGGEARWACVVGELGEQSGQRPTGGYPAEGQERTWNGIYGKPTAKGPANFGASQGTAARFYPNFTWQYEIAERLAGVVPFRYQAKASSAERSKGLPDGERNTNPCVKPLSLLVWLARLIAPPPEYAPRRLLVPFSGSGSEMCAALLSQNWDEIIGIEMEQSYVDIARCRLRFWADWAARGYDDPAAILKAAKREETRREKEQLELDL